MVAIGAKAPEFSLRDADGNTVSLAGLRGRKVVLYFYPKDDTPGCTKEACAFRDAQAEFDAAGAVVLGVSPDDEASHQSFRAKFSLSFPLLADPDHAVAEAYGVWQERSMYGRTFMGVERSTFVIDAQGILCHAARKVKVEGHAEEMLELARSVS
ncbi:MAG: thioredoxin-dependent thiol peroxidase [Gemmatimonadota bacterium]